MIISWYGEACFKLQAGETVLKSDPFEKKTTGLTTPYFRTDIVLKSLTDLKERGEQGLEDTEKTFTIHSPGEYEVREVQLRGIELGNESTEKIIKSIYLVDWTDIRIGYLGYLSNPQLDPKAREALSKIDILFVPVGGGSVLDAEAAVQVINQIEPRIVIPMLYHVKGLTRKADGVDSFLKELGIKGEGQEKLTIKKKEIEERKETQVIVLKAQSEG